MKCKIFFYSYNWFWLGNVFLLFLVSNVDTEIAEDILISDLMLWLHLYFSLGTSSFLVFWYFMTTSDDVHYMIYQISWWCTHYMMCIGVGILLSFYLDSQWVLSFWKFIPLESGTVKKSYLLIYFSPFSFFFFSGVTVFGSRNSKNRIDYLISLWFLPYFQLSDLFSGRFSQLYPLTF